jgi:hypothetical protein
MKKLKDTLLHSIIALLVSALLGLLIVIARKNPANQFELGWTGVVVCLMLTINYARNWKLSFINTPIPKFLDYWRGSWFWEAIHFIIVNVSFIIPLILFKAI